MKEKIFFACLAVCQTVFAISDEEFFRFQRFFRQVDTHTTKSEVAQFDESKSVLDQPTNGDEKRFSDLRGSFNKALVHQTSGFPDVKAFSSLVFALTSQSYSNFNKIQIGQGVYKLANPQASLVYTLSGNDSWINTMSAAPSFQSRETAGEMVELYWTALTRDVPFNEFATDATVAAAVADLNTLTNFKGPKTNGVVTPETYLRGNTSGDLNGPYISQFLYKTIPFGNNTIDQSNLEVPLPGTGNDFITTFANWFTVATGAATGDTISFDPTLRFIRTPRDLSEYVHRDSPGQAAFAAALYLDTLGLTAIDPANPYFNNPTQEGFVTFGISQLLDLIRQSIQIGLETAWYQKWQVHRRLRPEEFGFYVEQQVANGANLGISSELTNSAALPMIFGIYGSYFLPQAYPEGCPTHPSYPAGHAVLIGAAVTILKAYYNEDFAIPNPIEPNATNDALIPYASSTLTIGGELNKLAANISLGRDHAGVHYRSDGAEGLNIGEQVAIDLINNSAFLFNENFDGFTLTKFDGTTIRVGSKR